MHKAAILIHIYIYIYIYIIYICIVCVCWGGGGGGVLSHKTATMRPTDVQSQWRTHWYDQSPVPRQLISTLLVLTRSSTVRILRLCITYVPKYSGYPRNIMVRLRTILCRPLKCFKVIFIESNLFGVCLYLSPTIRLSYKMLTDLVGKWSSLSKWPD